MFQELFRLRMRRVNGMITQREQAGHYHHVTRVTKKKRMRVYKNETYEPLEYQYRDSNELVPKKTVDARELRIGSKKGKKL